MLEDTWKTMRWLLGLDIRDLAAWQMALRALIVYVAAIVMIRVSDKRFIGKNTAIDVVLGIVLGSVVSRAITGNAPFFPALGAGFVLVGLHWLIAAFAFRSRRFGALVKGSERTLISEGEVHRDNVRVSHISENDLREALRLQAHLNNPSEVKTALLERNGDISIIPQKGTSRVVEVTIKEGVQTVRIELT
jgi:uncharacterized membrane protein YcaP (DUF421 family)